MARDGKGWFGESHRHSLAAKGMKTGRRNGVRKDNPLSRQRGQGKVRMAETALDASLQPPLYRVDNNLQSAKSFLMEWIEENGDDHRVLRALASIDIALSEKGPELGYIEHVMQAKKELSAPTEWKTFEVEWKPTPRRPFYIVAPNLTSASVLATVHLLHLDLDAENIGKISEASGDKVGRGKLIFD